MISKIHNQNFGWSVTCDGHWAAVGNPSVLRYDPLTGSIIRTGSVEVYKYNINTDVHDFKKIIYRPLTPPEVMLLSTEFANSSSVPQTGPYWYIHTEYTGSVPITSDKDLLVDTGQYYSASEDGYGFALDIKEMLLVVGNPYFESRFTFATNSFFYTGSGYVDLYDLSKLDIDPYLQRISPTIVIHSFTGGIPGLDLIGVNVPGFQDYRYVYIQTKNTTIPNDDWQNIVGGIPPAEGGIFYLQTYYTSTDEIPLDFRVIGIVGTDPYLSTIYNPNSAVTESFGWSVSVNDEWLAVGSPLESGSRGSVFMFRKVSNDISSWSFAQSVPLPPDINPGDGFGSSVEVNKATGSFSGSMVVGSTKLSHSRAYIYEFDGTNWTHNFTLNPDNVTIYPLPFYPTEPIIRDYPNYADWFGYDVSMYEDSVMVGAPHDRVIQEYVSSSYYEEGAVYFFERCPNRDHGYYMVRKSYGNEKIMKNNLLGWSVSIRNPYAVAGIPKTNPLSSSICYLRGSLFQVHFCESTEESSLQGQFILYNEDTSSVTGPNLSDVDWDIVNIYQIKKRYLSPYRNYGWDIGVCEQFVIVGSPMLISGSHTVMAFYREAPLVPINLTVVSSSAALSWSYDYEYAEQDGFHIQKSTDGNIFTLLYTLAHPESRSFTDAAVVVNQWYYYRMDAYNDVGTSPYSNVASIFFAPPAPSGPIVLTAETGSYLGPSVLNWTFANNYQSGFNVERSLNGVAFANIATLATPSIRTYNDSAVSIDTTYWYRVNAYNSSGVSAYSNTASVYYPIPVPGGATVLSVDTGSMILQSLGTGSSILSWSYTSTTQTGWNIERSSSAVLGFANLITIASPTLRTYADSASIDANNTYWYRVQPYNGYGTGSYSNEDDVTFTNILYFSGSEKYYVNPTGYINESGSAWKGCYGYKNVNLTHLDVSHNSLTALRLISASALTILTCSYNNLPTLDIRSNPVVNWLNCMYNSLTDIKLNSGSALVNFWCGHNQLPSLNVSSCSGLWNFQCEYNQLTSLDVTHNVGLYFFEAGSNLLTTIDLTKNTSIWWANISWNQLTSAGLNLSGSTVQTLYLSHNLLSGANDYDNCTALSWLNIQNNSYPKILVGQWSASLVVLGIDDNPLGGVFDLTVYPKLSTLYCNNNYITNLDFTKSPEMWQIQSYGNNFTSLNFSASKNVYTIDTSLNGYITALDMTPTSCSYIGIHDCYALRHFSTSFSASTVVLAGCYNMAATGSASINQLYLDLDGNGRLNGTLNIRGTKVPSGSNIETARTNLLSKGWSINDDFGILTYTPSSSLIRWKDSGGMHGPSDLATYWTTADSASVSEIRVGSGSNGGDPIISISGLQYLPSLVTMSIYNNLLTDLQLQSVTTLLYLSASHNNFPTGAVNTILNYLVLEYLADGFVYLDGQVPPAPPNTPGGGYPDGLAATASLKVTGWTVVTDYTP